MPEHYPKDTVQVQVWCNVCHKETMHRVDAGRRGPCLACLRKRELEAEERKPVPPGPQQGRLF